MMAAGDETMGAAPAPKSAQARRKAMHPKSLFDEPAVLEAFERIKVKPAHAQRMWRYIVQQNVVNVRDIPDFPKVAAELIDKEFTLFTSKVLKETTSLDNSTTKLLIELQDGQKIETVIMRYGDVELRNYPEQEKEKRRKQDGSLGFTSTRRATVCVSSQVGCAMGCRFCATGTMGLVANLTAGEILEQLAHANRIEKIRNVVFMGMGEPLDNYANVLTSVRAMTDTSRYGLSYSRISLSTVGVVPRMYQLIQDMPDVSLAISLHAPNQELRTRIVPTGQAYPVEKIMAAMDAYVATRDERGKTKTKVMVEYVLIADVNDSDEVAAELGELLKDRKLYLNVIPYNPTAIPENYEPPTQERTQAFIAKVRTYGVQVLIRQELGQDISSACGQLVVESMVRPGSASQGGCSSSTADAPDIEDLMKRKRPHMDSVKAPASPSKRKVKFSAGTTGDLKSKYERGDMAMTGTAPGRSTWMVLAAVVIVIFIARFGFRIAKYFGPATHAVEL